LVQTVSSYILIIQVGPSLLFHEPRLFFIPDAIFNPANFIIQLTSMFHSELLTGHLPATGITGAPALPVAGKISVCRPPVAGKFTGLPAILNKIVELSEI
jgi:hypothetical protein